MKCLNVPRFEPDGMITTIRVISVYSKSAATTIYYTLTKASLTSCATILFKNTVLAALSSKMNLRDRNID